jgi:hypothetical protein
MHAPTARSNQKVGPLFGFASVAIVPPIAAPRIAPATIVRR